MPDSISQRRNTGRRLAAAYLLAQALLAVLWWLSMSASAGVRERFELNPASRSALDAFLVADLVVFIGGSIVSALTIARGSRWAPFATAFTAGGVVYATSYLLGWVLLEGHGVAGVPPMVAAAVVSTLIAIDTRRERDVEHRSAAAG